MERLKKLHQQGAISDEHFERRLEQLCDADGAAAAAPAGTADSVIDVEQTTGDAASGKRAATQSPPASPAKAKPSSDDDDDDEAEHNDDDDEDNDSDDDDDKEAEAPPKPQEVVKSGPKRFKGVVAGKQPAKTLAEELMSHKAPLAAIDKDRKPQARNTNGRGDSKKRQGGRIHDVKDPKLIDKRVADNPNQMLEKKGAIGCWNLYCIACKSPIGSSASDTDQHLKTAKHKTNLATAQKSDTNAAQIKKALTDYKMEFQAKGQSLVGTETISEATQIFRGELLEEWMRAGIEVNKIDNLRGFIERKAKDTLTNAKELMRTYFKPLEMKEHALLKAAMEGQFLGVYHDGTTHNGEAFCICVRFVSEDFKVHVYCIRVSFLRGSMTAQQITAELVDVLVRVFGTPMDKILAWMHDCVSANLSSFDSLSKLFVYGNDNGCLPHTGRLSS